MSSRILRSEDPAPRTQVRPVEAIQWRRHGTLPPQRNDTPAQHEGDRKEQDNVEQRIAEAQRQGFAAGEAAAAQRMQSRLDPVLAAFSQIVQDLAGQRKKFRAEAEASTVGLAMAIARRVL